MSGQDYAIVRNLGGESWAAILNDAFALLRAHGGPDLDAMQCDGRALETWIREAVETAVEARRGSPEHAYYVGLAQHLLQCRE